MIMMMKMVIIRGRRMTTIPVLQAIIIIIRSAPK